jgi:hypothetical protein
MVLQKLEDLGMKSAVKKKIDAEMGIIIIIYIYINHQSFCEGHWVLKYGF